MLWPLLAQRRRHARGALARLHRRDPALAQLGQRIVGQTPAISHHAMQTTAHHRGMATILGRLI